MKKLWYMETSWDNGWPLFIFPHWEDTLVSRLAGNPILLLEYFYNYKSWTDFMQTYNSVKDGRIKDCDKKNIKILVEAKKFCEDFISTIKLMQQNNKSLLVVYKE